MNDRIRGRPFARKPLQQSRADTTMFRRKMVGRGRNLLDSAANRQLIAGGGSAARIFKKASAVFAGNLYKRRPEKRCVPDAFQKGAGQ